MPSSALAHSLPMAQTLWVNPHSFDSFIGPLVARWLSLPSILCFLSLSVSLNGKDQEVLDEPALTKQVRDSVVTIRHMDRVGNESGVGTGFVIDANGLVATSLHVIGEARSIQVQLRDGSLHEPIAIHAWDRTLDLAVIELNHQDLKPLPLGDSDALASGEKVIAVGNPMGLERSVVNGLISGFRKFEHTRMIQLAIPIEPGNSGGPLFNPRGEVLGLLNLKSTLTPNLGFATPINALKPLLARPNSMTMTQWLRLGALDESIWTSSMGALWSSKVDRISVQGQGAGFGGRSLCHFHQQSQQFHYELEVRIKLGDESGAAGLIFGSDGKDRQYGFYPSNGQMRLTRFDGPSVYTWNILNQVQTPHYRPGEWNIIKVRHEANRILCFVNHHLVIESEDRGLRLGQVGLAKFRDTQADYAEFRLDSSPGAWVDGASAMSLNHLLAKMETCLGSREPSLESLLQSLNDKTPDQLRLLAEMLEHRTKQIRQLALESHRKEIRTKLQQELNQPEAEINLLRAALLIAKHDHPELNIQAYQNAVHQMVEDIHGSNVSRVGMPALLDLLVEFLFKENGYHGSFTDYENAANSYLDKVIDDREGLPITLSVLFIELAERLGIQGVTGLPLPGHFLVRCELSDGDVKLIDVFNSGKQMTFDEADALAFQYQANNVRSEHLEPASKREIIMRMLTNLRYFTQRNSTLEAVLPYLDMMVAIDQEDANLRLERATLRLRTGQRESARSDFQWLLEKQPEGLRLDRIREALRSL